MGLPFYETPLLSAWSPPVSAGPYYPPPARIPPQILQTMKTNENVAYAPLPRELRGRRNLVVAGAKKDSARFRSGKGRKEVSFMPIRLYVANRARHQSGADQTIVDDIHIPEFYRRVEIEYSKFGVEDFDFG